MMQQASAVFVAETADVTIIRCSFTGNHLVGSGDDCNLGDCGAAIFLAVGGHLSIADTAFSGNHFGYGTSYAIGGSGAFGAGGCG